MELRGVTHFHSETGTEGGYWAVQDERYTGLPSSMRRCPRCGRVWDPERQPTAPAATFTYWVEGEGRGNYQGFDSPQELAEAPPTDEPGSFNAVWTHERNEAARVCWAEGHEEWELLHPEGMWSYEGLHVLEDGDQLTIYSRDAPEEIVWEGEIALEAHPLFTEEAGGMWIHADQRGVSRDQWAKWFFEEHPARLVRSG